MDSISSSEAVDFYVEGGSLTINYIIQYNTAKTLPDFHSVISIALKKLFGYLFETSANDSVNDKELREYIQKVAIQLLLTSTVHKPSIINYISPYNKSLKVYRGIYLYNQFNNDVTKMSTTFTSTSTVPVSANMFTYSYDPILLEITFTNNTPHIDVLSHIQTNVAKHENEYIIPPGILYWYNHSIEKSFLRILDKFKLNPIILRVEQNGTLTAVRGSARTIFIVKQILTSLLGYMGINDSINADAIDWLICAKQQNSAFLFGRLIVWAGVFTHAQSNNLRNSIYAMLKRKISNDVYVRMYGTPVSSVDKIQYRMCNGVNMAQFQWPTDSDDLSDIFTEFENTYATDELIDISEFVYNKSMMLMEKYAGDEYFKFIDGYKNRVLYELLFKFSLQYNINFTSELVSGYPLDLLFEPQLGNEPLHTFIMNNNIENNFTYMINNIML